MRQKFIFYPTPMGALTPLYAATMPVGLEFSGQVSLYGFTSLLEMNVE